MSSVNPAPVDLKASGMCRLVLVERIVSGLDIGPEMDWTPYVHEALLPGTATVSVDGHQIVIPEGETRYVMSESRTFDLLYSVAADGS